MTVDSAAAAASAYAAAVAEGTSGGLCLATGVGAPAGAALEAGAIATVVDGAVCTVATVVATKAALKSEGFLQSSLSKLGGTTNHSQKLRNSLKYDLCNGQQEPSYKNSEHHIVASGAKKQLMQRKN